MLSDAQIVENVKRAYQREVKGYAMFQLDDCKSLAYKFGGILLGKTKDEIQRDLDAAEDAYWELQHEDSNN